MKRKRTIITLLAVLAILGTLVGVTAMPASAADFTITTGNCTTVAASITINATFPANTIITASLDGVAMITSPQVVDTGTSGTVSFAAKVPATTAGWHNLTVSDGVNTITKQLQVSPKIVVTDPTTKKGTVGSSVTIAGTGFSQGVSADIYMGNATAKTGGPVALAVPIDSTGSFSVVGTVPNVTAGSYDVWAVDGAGHYTVPGASECGVFDTFTVLPTLTISPPSGLAGTDARLYGTGWCAGGNVTVSIAGVGPLYTITIGSNTVLDKVIEVQTPAGLTAGTKEIIATCVSAPTITQKVNFTVVARPLTLSPATGPRGIMVLVTGSNMTPLGNITTGKLTIGGVNWNSGLTYPGGTYPGKIEISSGGVITPTSLPVPTTVPLGNNFVQALDDGGLEASGVFIVSQPTISLNSVTGPRGSTIIITGAGWLANEEVTIEFRSAPGAVLEDVDVLPDATGGFAASMIVPNVTEQGAYNIVAFDSWNNAATPKIFTVPGPAITVSPTSGGPTTPVTVSGTGFKQYIPINLTFGDYPIAGVALPNASGAFTFTFSVPGLAPGIQVILAKNNTQSANTFFTLSEAPVTIEDQLASCASVIVRVWGFSGGTWYMYDPADPTGSDLDTLTPGLGYWIEASAPCTLVYGAYSYPLATGWTLIGWR